eukprot:9468062-Pyramimonas_sp.AAC.1
MNDDELAADEIFQRLLQSALVLWTVAGPIYRVAISDATLLPMTDAPVRLVGAAAPFNAEGISREFLKHVLLAPAVRRVVVWHIRYNRAWAPPRST